MRADAIILAGGKLKDSNRDKAFIKIGEQTLLDMIIAALEGCPSIAKKIVTSVPKDYKKPPLKVDDVVYDSGDLLENIGLAIEKVKNKKVLIVASDIPLLTAEHIEEFISLCSKVDAGFYYPLIPKSAMGEFGSMKRTYFKLDRTEFTGGNMLLANKDDFLANLAIARKIFEFRKKPFKVVSILGPFFLIRMAFGRLSVSAAERKAGKILKTTSKGIIVRHPEIGSDIDKSEDLEFIKSIIGGNK